MALDTTVADAEAGNLRWLDARALKIFRDAAGHVRATVRRERSVIRPALLRAFPISAPELFIELREEDGEAVGMLRGLRDLDPDSRALAEELLRERYLVPRITEVTNVSQEFGNWVFTVATDRGERTFTVRSPREDIRPLPGTDTAGGRVHRIRITDADGNLYEIRDYDSLDARSKALFDRIG